ncbi:hypothetical protein [Accumulibacter sp.]|uniref:hypothetical protein n=1 Tax=Accumulibacter sp. TaxID=2053492 RepID=UPI0025CE727D|nr:hypothetical protein [Accumulibacter sp.]MCM8611989.1 hypothetical protein [Accumulibacter sp.]MCM8635849.1 hypothetical protein [Accumulibacter sp.]MCM8641925.1 hypothetical protein [Accumulibacter sp.]
MKTLLPLACAALFAATPAVAHEDHGKPRFGGVVAEAGHYQAELVARSDTLTIHVTEHGNPLPTAGGSARLTLLVGGKKTELTLVPAGNNRFEAKGSFDIKGAKVVAALDVPGKPPKTLRFALDDTPARL